jgi:hypothetical protein
MGIRNLIGLLVAVAMLALAAGPPQAAPRAPSHPSHDGSSSGSGSSGSGSSAESSADADVCAWVDDIAQHLNGLRAVPVDNTADAVESHVNAIKGDLSSIQSALPRLTAERKQQVQAASQTFEEQLNTIPRTLGSVSGVQALAQLKPVRAGLVSAFRRSFAKLHCIDTIPITQQNL